MTRNEDQKEHVKERVKKAARVMGQIWNIGKKKFGKDWGRRLWLFDRLLELFGRISRAVENLQETGAANITTGTVETRLQLLDNNWNKFETTHDQLCSTHWKAIAEHDYIKNNTYSLAEEAYLPSFTGKFEEWPAFKDLFQSIISKDAILGDVERLHYLKGCLKGEAEQMVRNIPLTSENYERVWNLLEEHFANKRLMVRACFASFTAIPKMKTESVSELRKLFHAMLQIVGTLKGINRPITDSDLFVHIVTEMLDSLSRREWETSISGSSNPPTYEELKIFLEGRVRTLEALHPATGDQERLSLKPAQAARGSRLYVASAPTIAERKLQRSCAVCRERHHSSIHEACARPNADDQQAAISTKPATSITPTTSLTKSTSAVSSAQPSTANVLHLRNQLSLHVTILLATARVYVKNKYGQEILVRTLIDPGFEVSIISESLTQKLNLPRRHATTAIYGIGGSKSGQAHGSLNLELKSCTQTPYKLKVMALVLPRVALNVQRTITLQNTWPHLQGLELADPEFQVSDPIEVILGAAVHALIIENGLRMGDANSPIALKTALGWVLSGIATGNATDSLAVVHHCKIDNDLSQLVSQFWRQEEAIKRPLPLTADDEKCEKYYGKLSRAMKMVDMSSDCRLKTMNAILLDLKN
ncbi:uncharacterized protein [Cardiocondyla obscurior]|uniref:uncharacterized protein n=1 Tax=Cardiocondyla obscurior TaxID=286306 RepID=UPI0039655F01